ncbi:ethanolamine ammonia-lyase subunit EutC [Pontibacillus yanchengensis]|uniref:ethanolamine ammonia-lyase subunit EutC n=1 Tax=Pontibacillus yanchengensis TaxID=462910 RepID=UPI001F007AFA|nr:ethanolamine ammonia-lyase subunit EutC [Pontibacillus yanchengensis]
MDINIEEVVKKVIQEIEDNDYQKKYNNRFSNETEEEKNFYYEKRKDSGVLVENPNNREVIEKVQSITPARIGIGRSGTRMKTESYLDFRVDHAEAQDAVFKDVSHELLEGQQLPFLKSQAPSMEEYLMDLEIGRKLDQSSAEWINENCSKQKQVQIIISDGLSSTGIEENIPDLLPALIQGLKVKNITYGDPIFIQRSRVWIQDQVASYVDCDLVISLIGERPGLATAKSISAYFIYQPDETSVEADRTVISNIHQGGIPPVEAGAYLADVLEEALKYKASGVSLSRIKNE